jgi:hypothetical protein
MKIDTDTNDDAIPLTLRPLRLDPAGDGGSGASGWC